MLIMVGGPGGLRLVARTNSGARDALRALGTGGPDRADRGYDVTMPHLTARTISSPVELDAALLDLRAAVQAGPITIATIPARALTPAEAGVVLGVSRQFVDRLIAQGELDCDRLPGSKHRRIAAEEIARFAEAREVRRASHRKAVEVMDAAKTPW